MTDHDDLLDRLRTGMANGDPPPPGLTDTAKAAFGLGRLEDELAELLHDTALEPAGTRGDDDGHPRLVSFGATEVGADVQISAAVRADEGCTVTGMVTGPVSVLVLQTPDAERKVDLDQHGRFRADGVVGRVLRLQLATRSGYNVVTPWVRVA